MNLLHQHGIKYKVIGVVTRETLRHPLEFYNFFFDRRQQLSGFHFNILAEGNSPNPNLAYSTEDRSAYYSFYRRILQLSREKHHAAHDFQVLNFSQGLARILGSRRAGAPRYFEEASAPLKALNLDVRGNVTTFYAGLSTDVLPDLYGDGEGFSLGNIHRMSLEDMIRSEKLRRMMQDFTRSTVACEASCEYFTVCSGGFDILKRRSSGTFDACETVECLIHVKKP